MNETKEIINSGNSLKQKIKELIKQVMDEITTSAAAGSGPGSAGVPRVPNWVSKSKKGRPDLATALGYTLTKPVNEAAEPNQDSNPQQGQDGGAAAAAGCRSASHRVATVHRLRTAAWSLPVTVLLRLWPGAQ